MLNRIISFDTFSVGQQATINPKTDIRRLELFIEATLSNGGATDVTVNKDDFPKILSNIRVVSNGEDLHSLSGSDVVAIARRVNGNDPMPNGVTVAAGGSTSVSLYFPLEVNAVIDDVIIETVTDGISGVTVSGKCHLFGNSRAIGDIPVRSERIYKSMSGTGQETHNKDSVKAPVSAIIVKGGSALSRLAINGTDQAGNRVTIIDNLPIDFLTEQEKYENDLEYSPDGEWGIVFDEPIDVASLQFLYTSTSAGSIQILVVY